MFEKSRRQVPEAACYPLDYSFWSLRDRAFEKEDARVGIERRYGPGMDDDGVLIPAQRKMGIGKEVSGAGRVIAERKDIYQNRRMANIGVKKAEEVLSGLERNSRADLAGLTGSAQGCAELLEEIHAAVSSMEEECVRRAILPARALAGRLERAARGADRRWSADTFLADLSGREDRLQRQLRELTDRTDILFGFTDDVKSGMSLTGLMEKYPQSEEGFTRLLRANGYMAKPAGCLLKACSWSEDPELLMEILRPMYRAKRERRQDEEAAAPSYEEVCAKVRKDLGERRYGELVPYMEFYRLAAEVVQETDYLEQGFGMQLRRVWPGIMKTMGAGLSDPDDLKYLFYEELTKECREGALSQEAEEKIRGRSQCRPKAENKWQEMNGEPARKFGRQRV